MKSKEDDIKGKIVSNILSAACIVRYKLERLSRSFLGILLIGVVFLSAPVLFGGLGQVCGHDLTFYGIVDMRLHFGAGFLAALTWIMVVAGLSWITGKVGRLSHDLVFACAIVLTLALGTRVAFLCFSPDGLTQISDNQLAWVKAIGGVPYNKYLLGIPRWMNYTLFLRCISCVFGSGQEVAASIGVFLDAAVAVLVLLLAHKVTGSFTGARVAAISYALFPSCIAYSVVNTPEHLGGFCFLLSSYCFLGAVHGRKPAVSVAWAVASGMMLGLADSVKPLGPLFMIAYLLFICLTWRKCNRRSIMVALSLLLLVSGVCLTVSRGITCLSECQFKVRLADKNSPAHMLLVGLNRCGEGQIHLNKKICRKVEKAIKAGATMETASKIAYKTLRDDWRDRYSEIPAFVLKKALWVWQDFNAPFRFVSVMHSRNSIGLARFNAESSGVAMHGVPDFMPPMAQILYVLLMLTAGIAVLMSVFGKDGTSPHVHVLTLICLVVTGYFFLSMIIEGQSRYKSLILPYVFVIAVSRWRRFDNG